MSDKQLYTWVDVQNRLREFQDSPDGREWFKGKSARAYWDGLRFSIPSDHADDAKKAIQAQLGEIFLARYDQDKDIITLGEAPNAIPFSVFFEEEEREEDLLKEYFRAEFSPLSYVADITPFSIERTRGDDEPVVLAFHSFKGGVGRTLHAIALAFSLSQKGNKVLLIDADFEAPGISWYFSNPVISLADLMAMAHGDSIGFDYTLKNAADQTPLNSTVENIQVLPAFRDPSQFGEPIIKPEHLNTSNNPFLLQDLVIELGKKLEVDYIIVDLRAGLSELSSGWLLDPKIYKVIVTTLSGQSLRGSQHLLKRTSTIHNKFKLGNKENDVPFLLFSQVSTDFKIEEQIRASWENESDTFGDQDFTALKKEYIALFDNETNDDSFVKWAETACFSIEYSDLKNLPHDWTDIVTRIENSSIRSRLEPLENWLPQPPNKIILPALLPPDEEAQLPKKRIQLSEAANNLIHADKAVVEDFLITQPIEQLAIRSVSKLPIAVVVGAKGSGKTYLFKSLIGFDDWSDFVKKVRPQANGEVVRAKLCQVTTSENVSTEERGKHRDVIKSYIEQELLKPLTTASQWRAKWLDIIAWANGTGIGREGAWNEFLEQNVQNVICLFDGLEEIFAGYFEKETHKTALRSLLQDVPNWLESLPQRNIGIVIFVRQDIVSYVIPQNVGQFLSRYKEYQLKWNEEEALRLTYWVAAEKAEVIAKAPGQIKDLSKAYLEELLYPLWGQKLGSNKSREARTAAWVFDALSNFQDEVQSRDIVRFLNVAADKLNTTSYDDRILTPAAIKASIAEVGSAKLEELSLENKYLYDILMNIRAKSPRLQFPCDKSQLGLTAEDQDILEKNGILRDYNGEYYLAEIYRRGLGIGYSKRGKPRQV